MVRSCSDEALTLTGYRAPADGLGEMAAFVCAGIVLLAAAMPVTIAMMHGLTSLGLAVANGALLILSSRWLVKTWPPNPLVTFGRGSHSARIVRGSFEYEVPFPTFSRIYANGVGVIGGIQIRPAPLAESQLAEDYLRAWKAITAFACDPHDGENDAFRAASSWSPEDAATVGDCFLVTRVTKESLELECGWHHGPAIGIGFLAMGVALLSALTAPFLELTQPNGIGAIFWGYVLPIALVLAVASFAERRLRVPDRRHGHRVVLFRDKRAVVIQDDIEGPVEPLIDDCMSVVPATDDVDSRPWAKVSTATGSVTPVPRTDDLPVLSAGVEALRRLVQSGSTHGK